MRIGDDELLTASGVGTAVISTPQGKIIADRTLLVPKLARSLLSVRKLVEHPSRNMSFHSTGCVLTEDN